MKKFIALALSTRLWSPFLLQLTPAAAIMMATGTTMTPGAGITTATTIIATIATATTDTAIRGTVIIGYGGYGGYG